jgi:formiminotetrahydrofolate cyclodeaminase
LTGAWRNVAINVDQIKDEAFQSRVNAEGDEIRQRAAQRLQDVLDVLGRR